ncbi:MAG: hypothetical protein CBC00_06130 [Verrucomicrobia bacterium TMED40]|nr:MAG: hypothetical protein CBC00_06130 [Verrucomicrobia bacterium TMED40]
MYDRTSVRVPLSKFRGRSFRITSYCMESPTFRAKYSDVNYPMILLTRLGDCPSSSKRLEDAGTPPNSLLSNGKV